MLRAHAPVLSDNLQKLVNAILEFAGQRSGHVSHSLLLASLREAAIAELPAASNGAVSPESRGRTVNNDVGMGAIVGGAIVALIGGLFAWLGQRVRGRTDREVAEAAAQSAIEVAVMAEWKKLNDALSKRVTDLEEELATVRRDHSAEIEEIRRKHSAEIEEIRNKHRTEMRAMREQNDELRKHNDALQRIILQNSQSTAQLISESPVTKGDDGGE